MWIYKDKMPVGLQIIAPQFEEGRLFHLGGAYEQATPLAPVTVL
jgi:Asp-tRNA(Asn)/Glu-tRNA(Gln) amidotransferase A subunit family amidase